MTRPGDPFPETSLGGYLPAGRRPPAEAPGPTGHAAVAALEGALARLEEALGRETEALEARESIDLDEMNRLKSRSLLEFTRLGRTLPPGGNPRLREAILRLHEGLVRNQAVLRLHLEAVQEISGLLASALDEAESDGTYGLAPRRRGTAP